MTDLNNVTPRVKTANISTNTALSEEAFVRALYHVFLFREPDTGGLASGITQLRNGKTFEELLNWCLRSTEFLTKYQHFIQTYIGPQVTVGSGLAVPLRFVPLDAPPMQIECRASAAELEQLVSGISEAWTSLGAARPYHSVLTSKEFLPENIDSEAIETFWKSGSKEAAKVMSVLRNHDFHDPASKICVEYGCGLGRVTDTFANTFEKIYAYDVSSTHLDAARSRIQSDNIEFVLCNKDTFKNGLCKCDFFYSNIVMQHNPPPVIRKLISMGLDALKPDGIAIFQVPTYAAGYSFNLHEYLGRQKRDDMEMHVIPQAEVFSLIKKANCELLEVREDGAVGRIGKWISNTFIVKG